jgi:hypothetical protein
VGHYNWAGAARRAVGNGTQDGKGEAAGRSQPTSHRPFQLAQREILIDGHEQNLEEIVRKAGKRTQIQEGIAKSNWSGLLGNLDLENEKDTGPNNKVLLCVCSLIV